MGTRGARIAFYANDASLMADDENDLQRLLFGLHKAFKQFDSKISITNTKALTIINGPLISNFGHQGQDIQQLVFFNYLGIIISSRILTRDVVQPIMQKAARLLSCLNDTMCQYIFHKK